MKVFELLIIKGILFLFYLGLVTLLSFWTHNELSHWVVYAKGAGATVPRWVSWVASIPFPLTFLLDIVSSVARQFV